MRRRRAIQRGAVRTGKPARQRVKAPKSDDVWGRVADVQEIWWSQADENRE